MRAESGREANRVFKVVFPAFGQIYSGQFRIRFFVVGYRRYYSRVKGAYGYGVFQRAAHSVSCESLYVSHYHFVRVFPESFSKSFHFGRCAAAPCRSIGLVGHEHSARSEFVFVEPVYFFHLRNEFLHYRSHVSGVKAGYVVGGISAVGKKHSGKWFYSAFFSQCFVLYHYSD